MIAKLAGIFALALLGGCTFDLAAENALPFGQITVSASEPGLSGEFEHQIKAVGLSGARQIHLTLSETTDNTVTARTSAGAASTRQLSYALHYQIVDAAGQSFNGVIRNKQTISHTDTTQLANEFAFDRYYASARIESIERLLRTLQLRNWQ